MDISNNKPELMDTLSGQTVRGYRLDACVGAGGFGAVYKAHQTAVSRDVAIKVILPEYANHPDFIRRFEAEAQIIARLEHPHIVPLYDYWREAEGAYLVMRWLRGGSLHESLNMNGPLQPGEAATLFEQITPALALAHRNGVIHRDIKPSNILLDDDKNAYLSDFGIAKDLEQPGMTQSGAIVGSPDYLSPEQIEGYEPIPQTDIYSLGFILYEILTGERPFQGETFISLLNLHLNEPVPPAMLKRPDLPEAIDAVIQRATRKNPADRYPDVLSMARDLRQAVGGEIESGSFKSMATTLSGEFAPGVAATTEEAFADIPNPYKGLRAFEIVDADDFFGREALTENILARLTDSRFVAVIGPSGIGKSSVVKAGVIPAVWAGDLPGSEAWFTVEMTPGPHPLEELEVALLRVAVNAPASLIQQIKADSRGLLRAVRRILPDDDAEIVLAIDQFEETFTLCEDDAERRFFLESLAQAATASESRLRVILTMRADFYDRPLLHAEFGDLFRRSTEAVMPMSTDQLRRTIIGPAERVGLRPEPGLVEAIIADISEQPGALPMLQYALTELFERREGRILTLQAYRESGGVMGALARRADEIYESLDEAGQYAARQLFLRLVTLGEGTEDTRRRAARTELDSLSVDGEALDHAIDAYGRYRILTFDRDPVTRLPVVEIAHEALIRTWSRLSGWLDASREDLRSQRMLRSEASLWEESGRDSSYLARGTRLTQLEEWAQSTEVALTANERAYLEASIARREQERAADEARQRERERLVERSRRIQRALMIVSLIAAVGGVILSLLVVREWRQAEAGAATATFALGQEEIARIEAATQAAAAQTAEGQAVAQAETALAVQKTAERGAVQNRSLALANSAQRALINLRPDDALMLALEANAIEDPPGEAWQALVDAATFSWIVGRADYAHALTAAAFFPDGKTMIAGAEDGTLILLDAQSGEILQTLEGHETAVISIGIGPDGKAALSGAEDGAIMLWDLETGTLTRTLSGMASTGRAALSPDGRAALSAAENGDLILWDLRTGTMRSIFHQESEAVATALAFSTDGLNAISGAEDGTLTLWDARSGHSVRTFGGGAVPAHTGPITAVAFGPDGTRFLSASEDKTLILWDAETGQRLHHLRGHESAINAAALSPDGRTALSAADNGTLILWDMREGDLLRTFRRHTGPVNALDFGPDGVTALSASSDRSLILWDTRVEDRIRTFHGHDAAVSALALSSSGLDAVSGGADGTMIIWNVATGEAVHAFPREHTGAVNAVAFAPGGGSILSASADDTLILWDIATGEPIRTFTGHARAVNAAAFSPDGALILSASADGTLILWDAGSGEPIRTLAGHSDYVNAVAFGPDGLTALSGSEDRTLILWDIRTGEPIRTFAGHEDAVKAAAFSPDGRTAVSGGRDNALILWDVETGEALYTFLGHSDYVNAVAFNPAGDAILSASDDNTLILWDVESRLPLRRFAGHTGHVLSAAFSPDGRAAISGSADRQIILWKAISYPGGLLAWTQANRYVPELTCRQREQFNLPALCDAGGSAPTRTPFPTLPPTATLPPSPTTDLTRTTATTSPTPILSPAVVEGLALAGANLEDGSLAARRYETYIDMTDADNLIRWDDFDGTYADFIMGATFTWGPGAAEDECGVVFRKQDNANYYSVRMDQKGSAYFRARIDDEKADYFIDGSFVRAGRANSILLVGSGDTFSVYVNGRYAGQFTDFMFAEGTIGLAAVTFGESYESGCLFEEAWVWQMEEAPFIASPTPSPSNTPTPTVTPAPPIIEALAVAGIGPESGYLAEQHAEIAIDLSDDDNTIEWDLLDGTYADFVMGATFNWGPGAAEDECAFIFRRLRAEDYYAIRANREGDLYFRARVDDETEDLIYGTGSAIRTDAPNNLMLVVAGDTFSVYVNGQYAGQFQDARFTEGGVAVAGVTYDESDASNCTFSDVWVWDLAFVPVTPPPSPTSSPSPSLTASPTPPPQILEALETAGIAPESGYIAEQRESVTVDVSDKDNMFEWKDFDGIYADFVMGATFEWGPGAAEDFCGFVFREQDADNLLSLSLDRLGGLKFARLSGAAWGETKEGRGDSIDTAPDALNHLMLIASGDTFIVYVNGQRAGRFRDDTFADGEVALQAGTYDESDESFCTYTGAWIWVPAEGLSAPPTPSPTAPPVEPVAEALASAGLSIEEGKIVAKIPSAVIDLTEENNMLRMQAFEWEDGSTTADFAAGFSAAWGPGDPEDGCGFAFRRTDNDLYSIEIDREGRVWFRKITDGEFGERVIMEDAPGIRTDADQTNDLMLVAVGQTFTLYVNGEVTATFEDAAFTEGTVSLAAETFAESDETRCTFSDAWLWQMESANKQQEGRRQ